MRTHKGAQREKGVVVTLVSCEGISSFRSRPGSTEKHQRLYDERCKISGRKEMKVLIVLSIQTTWGMLHLLRMIMRLESYQTQCAEETDIWSGEDLEAKDSPLL